MVSSLLTGQQTSLPHGEEFRLLLSCPIALELEAMGRELTPAFTPVDRISRVQQSDVVGADNENRA